MSICADERLCKRTTSYCPGSHHFGLEGEEGKKKNKTTKVQSTPIVFLTINRQNLFGLKSQAVPGQDPTTTARYVGGSHMHTSYLSPPASLTASTMFQFVKPFSAIAGGTRGTAQVAHVLLTDKN